MLLGDEKVFCVMLKLGFASQHMSSLKVFMNLKLSNEVDTAKLYILI